MAISKASIGLQNAEVNTLSKALCELYKANGAVSTNAAHSRLSASFAPQNSDGTDAAESDATVTKPAHRLARRKFQA